MNCLRLSAVAGYGLTFLTFVVGCWPTPTPWRSGGYLLTYRLATGESADDASMVRAIQSRLDLAGFKGAVVRSAPDEQFEIELPGADAEALSQVKKLLGSTGSLEFRILAHKQLHPEVVTRALEPSEGEPTRNESFWRKYDPQNVVPGDSTVTRVDANQDNQVLVLNDTWNLNGSHLKSATAGVDSSLQPCLLGQWKGEGPFLMAQMTTAHPPGSEVRLAIIYDDVVIAAPVIQEKITEQFQITGNFTQQEIDIMVATLKSGRLPARLDATPVSERRVEPQ